MKLQIRRETLRVVLAENKDSKGTAMSNRCTENVTRGCVTSKCFCLPVSK